MADEAAGLLAQIARLEQTDRRGRRLVCAVCGDPIKPCPDPQGPPVPCPPWHHTTGGHDHSAVLGDDDRILTPEEVA